LTPTVDPVEERWILSWGKSIWELHAQLLEELYRADVRQSFESATDDRPHHTERLDPGVAALRIDQLRFFLQL
jgi:hypothetical protein